MIGAKPFDIPKREVWEAFKRVRANQGAAGVDGQSIRDFEVRLADNLYKLWNRLSSGSYMPPPVRRVEIPKANGGMRPLGIPTVADRVAQPVTYPFKELTVRLRKGRCELCEEPGKVQVHQIRKLAQLGQPGPGQPAWANLMASMLRKTLVVCHPCHEAIHATPATDAA